MPIIVAASEGSPLCQGDILKGVPFTVTGVNGQPEVDGDARYVLVTSRPCNALRDRAVTVAPVYAWKLDLPAVIKKKEAVSEISLDQVRRFLANVRDGGQLTDQFYLGPLEASRQTRYSAQLGTLSTIRIPEDVAQRASWIREHRVCRLDGDLSRDLHVRLFNTQARLGFDDEGWLPDADLDFLIAYAEGEVAQRQSRLAEAKVSALAKEATGTPSGQDQLKSVASREMAVADAQAKLDAYTTERSRRGR